MKAFSQVAIPLILVVAISCSSGSPSPDGDLAAAILLGDLAQAQKALDSGANVNAPYSNGMTPLMYACREFKRYHSEAGGEVAVGVKVDFDNSKTDVDVQARNVHASQSAQTVRGNRAMVELLLARGADVNAKGRDGETALSLAIQNNLPEIAEVLRKAGARE